MSSPKFIKHCAQLSNLQIQRVRVINDIRMDLFHQGVDIKDSNILSFILNHSPERRKINASLLYEVPCKEGNERPQEYNDEERKTSYAGNMPYMRH